MPDVLGIVLEIVHHLAAWLDVSGPLSSLLMQEERGPLVRCSWL